MATPINSQQQTLNWMVDVMRANPEAHPNWIMAQVARRCPDDAANCHQIYQQARRIVGDAYHAAPLNYQPAARLHGAPPKVATADSATGSPVTLQEVTIIGDPHAPSTPVDAIPVYASGDGVEYETPLGKELKRRFAADGLTVHNIQLETNGIPTASKAENGRRVAVLEVATDAAGNIDNIFWHQGSDLAQSRDMLTYHLMHGTLPTKARPAQGNMIISVELSTPTQDINPSKA